MSGSDPAAARWLAIQLARAIGVACALTGIAIVSQRLAALAGLPAWLGLILVASGLAEVVLVPAMLARRWRTPPA